MMNAAHEGVTVPTRQGAPVQVVDGELVRLQKQLRILIEIWEEELLEDDSSYTGVRVKARSAAECLARCIGSLKAVMEGACCE